MSDDDFGGWPALGAALIVIALVQLVVLVGVCLAHEAVWMWDVTK